MSLLIPALTVLLLLAEEGGAIQVALAKGWYLRERALARGDRLSALSELTGKEPGDLILDCGSAGSLSYSCSRLPCRVPVCSTQAEGVKIQRVDPRPGPGSVSMAASANVPFSSMLASLKKREPKQPETLGVRGGGSANDAVLLESDVTLHLAPALKRVLEGRYCFRLKRLPGSGPERTFVVNWDRAVEPEGLAKPADLMPGTYTLEVGPASGACEFTDADRTPAWVVVAGDQAFARAEEQWKAYAPSLRQLEQSGATPAVIATVRHAILASLGDAVEKR